MKRTDLSLMRTATDIQQAFTCRIRNLAGHVCVPLSIYFLYNMVTYCTGEVNKGPCITLGLGGFATFFRPGCRREGRRPTTCCSSWNGVIARIKLVENGSGHCPVASLRSFDRVAEEKSSGKPDVAKPPDATGCRGINPQGMSLRQRNRGSSFGHRQEKQPRPGQ